MDCGVRFVAWLSHKASEVSTFCEINYKAAVVDRIISVAEGPIVPAGVLARGRRKWRLSHPYNGPGLCDSPSPRQPPVSMADFGAPSARNQEQEDSFLAMVSRGT
ncbi:MAG: hypothetical protein ACR2QA_05920 [Solirubrobacteraceae bacterium]